jgi:hypothetical protein
MKIETLLQKWNDSPSCDNSFIRIDDTHILDIYVGKDNNHRREIMIVSDIEPSKINSNKALDIQKGKRTDGKWATRIILIKSDEEEVFTHLCWDLIEQSRYAVTKSSALDILTTRFLKWQKLLESGTDLLSNEVIRGLIGELIYIRHFLKNDYSWDEIMSSWMGPEGSDKDFVFNNTWVEVKTIIPGKTFITISSLEQLDSVNTGVLSVITLDNTTSTDTVGFSFYDIISEIHNELKTFPSALFAYESKLISLGYYERKEYHEKYFALKSIRNYTVNESFPKLLHSSVSNSITNARYDISLPSIISHLMEV